MYALEAQLTDEMIAAAIADQLESTQQILLIAIAMIAVFILLVVLSAFRKYRRNKAEGRKSNLVLSLVVSILPLAVFGGIIGVVLTRQDSLQTDQEHADEWHVVTSEIVDVKKEEKTSQKKKKRNGKTYYEEYTDTYYYAFVKGFDDRVSISSSDYVSLAAGEPVYTVVDYQGDIVLLYSMEEYEYLGTRLGS